MGRAEAAGCETMVITLDTTMLGWRPRDCLGRPYAAGLAIAGAVGVAEVIANVLAEFALTLGLRGLTSVPERGPEALWDSWS